MSNPSELPNNVKYLIALALIFTSISITISNAEIDIDRERAYNLKIKAVRLQIRASEVMLPCLVSWYGEEFAGRATASGEIYSPTALTCACNFLPIGTVVEFNNNGKSIILRVNDRGSFDKKYGRHFDVSEEAAKRLGMHKQGVQWMLYRVK